MLGEIENPYPYISKADLMISLSLSEACPLGVQEAKILHIPVVATDFGSAWEFVIRGEGGKVVPLAEMTDCLYRLLSDDESLNAMKQELKYLEFDNERIVRKIEDLLIEAE
jgi:glycosyltransferase involved in cell wall biosynthesis